ncbi:LCCL domain-containing protein [Aggregatilineales bacterium SYSU G02658]
MKKWLAVVGCIGALVFGVSAQDLNNTAENSGVNLRVRYPDNWSAEIIPEFGIILQNFEGWTISIGVGETITSSFIDAPNAAPTMPATAAILEIAKLLDPNSYDLDDVLLLPLPQGDGLLITGRVTEEGITVPVIATTFNLPADGRLVVATLFNETTREEATPSISLEYEKIIGTVEAMGGSGSASSAGVAIADMPPNTLVFRTGATVTFPDGWAIYSEEPFINDLGTLYKGAQFIGAPAIIVINVYNKNELPIEFIGSFMLPMLAPIYTGREDFDAARDLVEETLADGRFFRFLDVATAENSLGNFYVVELDANSYMTLIVTILDREPITSAEVEAIARSATAGPMMEGLGGPADPNDVELAEPFSEINLPLVEIECRFSAFDLTFDPTTQRAFVACPANCTSGSVWGTDIYTADSSVCRAAAHAGAINAATGGRVLVTSLPGQDSYAGTERNGITTSSWGSYRASFSVAPAEGAPISTPRPSATAAPSVNVRQLGLQTQPATCDLRVSTDVVNESSIYALFECPAGCTNEYYAVWGTDVYTGDSYLCAAAIHAGALTDAGGLVLITRLPGREEYTASERNGISTSSWGGWGESFIAQGVDPATGQTR